VQPDVGRWLDRPRQGCCPLCKMGNYLPSLSSFGSKVSRTKESFPVSQSMICSRSPSILYSMEHTVGPAERSRLANASSRSRARSMWRSEELNCSRRTSMDSGAPCGRWICSILGAQLQPGRVARKKGYGRRLSSFSIRRGLHRHTCSIFCASAPPQRSTSRRPATLNAFVLTRVRQNQTS
jgi:hypothetical protein